MYTAEQIIGLLRQADVELGKGRKVGVRTLFIERGSPHLQVGSNGYVESFNGKPRDELLNGEIFYTLREAKIMTERWRDEYNRRPHSSLGYRPPAPEAIAAGGPAAEERGSGIIVIGAT